MSAPTTPVRVYPLPVDQLTDRVREDAEQAGAWPSLRQVMTRHRVGRPKAVAALDALRTAGFDPAPAAAAEVPADDPAGGADAEVRQALTDFRGDQSSQVAPAVDAAPDTTGSAVLAEVPAEPLAVSGPAPGRWSWVAGWPLALIGLAAFVAIWSGWVGLGELTGFGPIRLLPGIADHVVVNSAITLPIGVEAYAAFALRAWLAPAGLSDAARRFARWSALGALALGAAGQVAYHLMVAAGVTAAPWPITAFVACLPVAVLGAAAALAHLVRESARQESTRYGATA